MTQTQWLVQRCLLTVMTLLLALTLWAGAAGAQEMAPAESANPIYKDQSLPFSVRAADLVSRMTIEEKTEQFNSTLPSMFMGPPAAAIPRLGVRSYSYWSEALHGVARQGLATEFSTGQGIAATWNRDMVRRMTQAVSDEARAKYNDVCLDPANQNKFDVICRGLTYWSPTINMARDPRWGRADENYGEDPYLAGEIAGQFVLGLQGGNTSRADAVGGKKDSYLKAVSTPKHYLANSSEINRHTGASNLTDRSLHEYYTAAFGKAAGKEYGARSLMPSYNAINVDSNFTSLTARPTVVKPSSESDYRGVETQPTIGTPAPASKYAIETLMRRMWGFEGFITSDCGAIDDVYETGRMGHNWKPAELGRQVTPAEGAAWALKAGTDVDCWAAAYRRHLPVALATGLATEQDWDVALTRAFTIRMQLGEFDDKAKVPWANDKYVSDNPEHGVTARSHWDVAHEMSLEAPILLKNATVNGTPVLPLTNPAGKTVVLGWFANNPVHGGYSPDKTSNTITAAQGIERIVGNGDGDITNDANLYVKADAILNQVGVKPGSGNLELLDAAGKKVGEVSFWDYKNVTGWTQEPGFFGEAFNATTDLVGGFTIPIDIPAGVVAVRLPLSGSDVLPENAATSPEGCAVAVGDKPCNTNASFQVSIGGVRRSYPIQYAMTMGRNSNVTSGYIPLEIPLGDFAHPTGRQTLEFRFTIGGGDAAAANGLNLTRCQSADCRAAADQATDEARIRQAENVIVYIGTRQADSDEERDRESLRLPRFQAELARVVAGWNPRAVVWIQAVSQMDLTPFNDQAGAIVFSTYNGEFQGHAVGEILFNRAVKLGDKTVQATPSGHLPYTWYDNVDTQLTQSTDYALSRGEGAPCGRTYWYYTPDGDVCRPPLYRFGHGLSYTTFSYSDLKLSRSAATPDDTVTVSVKVTNTGKKYTGRAVAQLYVASPLADGDKRPFRQLKGFAKSRELRPGQSETLRIPLRVAEMWFWDAAAQKQVFDTGAWTIAVGPSSHVDGALTAQLTVSGARRAGVAVVAAVPDGVQLNMLTPQNAIHANLSATRHDQSFWDLTDPAVKVTYTSGNEKVAKVDATGAVLPVGVGATLITARVEAGGETGVTTFPVVVHDGPPARGGESKYNFLLQFPDATVSSGTRVRANVVAGETTPCQYLIAPMDLNEAGATITPEGVLSATGKGRVRVTAVATVNGVSYSRSALITVR